jgi:hypothetical protein
MSSTDERPERIGDKRTDCAGAQPEGALSRSPIVKTSLFMVSPSYLQILIRSSLVMQEAASAKQPRPPEQSAAVRHTVAQACLFSETR